MPPKHYMFVPLLVILALTSSACGTSASTNNEAVIATAVALTVQAERTLAAQATPLPSPTNLPPILASALAVPTRLPPTPPPTGAAGKFCTASASLVGETVPDGTIFSPGAIFTKVWRIKNTGTCAWDATWKIVFYDGDLLGGAYVYNFPQPAQPGETVEVPIVFTAPTQDGTYTGRWKLQSPWGTPFGVGDYDSPFWVKIVVGSMTPGKGTETVFGVTSVTYEVTRRCTTANTFYDITAYITTNGPLTVVFTTEQSDGHREGNNTLKFTQAGTRSFTWTWSQHIGSSTSTRWARIVVTSPVYQEFDKVTLPPLCW